MLSSNVCAKGIDDGINISIDICVWLQPVLYITISDIYNDTYRYTRPLTASRLSQCGHNEAYRMATKLGQILLR